MEFTLLPVVDMFASQAGADDVLFTAVCDMASMIQRGGVTLDDHHVKAMANALLTCYQQLPQEFWAEMIVKAMGSLQGLCPNQTWSDWQLLNGC